MSRTLFFSPPNSRSNLPISWNL